MKKKRRSCNGRKIKHADEKTRACRQNKNVHADKSTIMQMKNNVHCRKEKMFRQIEKTRSSMRKKLNIHTKQKNMYANEKKHMQKTKRSYR